MSNDIIDFIKKQDNLFDAAKYFGGMGNLRKLSKKNDELKSFIKSLSEGWLSIKASNGRRYNFDFNILDFDVDEYDGGQHIMIVADLIVDYPNLTNDELLTIGKWASEYLEDDSPYEVSTPEGLVDDYVPSYYRITVRQINGENVPWEQEKLLDNPDLVIPDETVEELIKKSKMSKEPVTESLIQLQNLFNKVL
jgi:hypothetical protein